MKRWKAVALWLAAVAGLVSVFAVSGCSTAYLVGSAKNEYNHITGQLPDPATLAPNDCRVALGQGYAAAQEGSAAVTQGAGSKKYQRAFLRDAMKAMEVACKMYLP